MAAAATLMVLITHGILLTVGVFLKPISMATGIDFLKVYYSCFFSSISAALVALFIAPKLIARIGAKKCYLIAIILNTLFFLISSTTTTSPINLYIGFTFGGVGMAIGGYACTNVFISRWFISKRSIVLGVVYCVLNIGIGAWQILAGILVQNFGFVVAYRIFAACVFLIGMPVILFWVKEPAEINEQALLVKDDPSLKIATREEYGPGRSAIKTAPFWLIFAALIMCAMSNGTYDNNVSSYVVSLGYSIVESGSVTGIRSVIVGLGSLAGGVIISKLGEKKTFIAVAICMIASLLVCSFANSKFMIWLSMILSAAYGPCTSALIAAVTLNCFGSKDYGELLSTISANSLLSTALMIFMSSIIIKLTGSVRGSFILNAGLVAVAIVLFLIGYAKSPMVKDNCASKN